MIRSMSCLKVNVLNPNSFFDDTSPKLDACQLERHRNKTFETFFIGHVRYESRALHKKLSILIGMLILTFLFAYQI